MKRDLHADLAICEAASQGTHYAEVEEWPGNANLRHWVVGLDDGIGCFVRYEDAKFDAEAREGWPEAIRRAIAAEAELTAEEERRVFFETEADIFAKENEFLCSEIAKLYAAYDSGVPDGNFEPILDKFFREVHRGLTEVSEDGAA